MGEGARRKTLISAVQPSGPLKPEDEETRALTHTDMASDPMGWLPSPGMEGGDAPLATMAREPLSDISQARTWGAPHGSAEDGVPALTAGGNS